MMGSLGRCMREDAESRRITPNPYVLIFIFGVIAVAQQPQPVFGPASIS